MYSDYWWQFLQTFCLWLLPSVCSVPLSQCLAVMGNVHWWKICPGKFSEKKLQAHCVIWMLRILSVLMILQDFCQTLKNTLTYPCFAGTHSSPDLQLYGIRCQISPRMDWQTAELSTELRQGAGCHLHDLSNIVTAPPREGFTALVCTLEAVGKTWTGQSLFLDRARPSKGFSYCCLCFGIWWQDEDGRDPSS